MRKVKLVFFEPCFTKFSFLLFLLASLAYLINKNYFHFPGNSYFPVEAWLAGLQIVSIYLALKYYCKPNSYWLNFTKYFTALYFCVSLIAFATNAVQFTPLSPIDNSIIDLENTLGINMQAIVEWTASHVCLYRILQWFYEALVVSMIVIPISLIIFAKYQQIMEYLNLLLISCIIGFCFYYLYPTIGPASAIRSAVFSSEQYATGIKFNELHHFIKPSTMAGGMIALPSFHVIWAWLTGYALKPWPILFFSSLVFNGIIILSCVLLGWHYPIDLLGSALVIFLSHKTYNHCRKYQLFK